MQSRAVTLGVKSWLRIECKFWLFDVLGAVPEVDRW
jgi:hypothetical protein